MDCEVKWSAEALSDLEGIAEYISKDSLFYASAFVQEALGVSATLSTFYERGRVVPELGHPDIRELFVKEYRLIYHISEIRIVILALIHGARDLKKLWAEEKRG